MKLEDIQERIRKIEACRCDDEMAHGEEDELHQDVLRAIADGTLENPALAAKTALQTLDIKFARWCA